MNDETTPPTYALTRFVLLRLLALVYAVAFLVIVLQFDPLLGPDGLLPVPAFLDSVRGATGSSLNGFLALPTLFWLVDSTTAMHVAAWVGFALSIAALLGVTNAALQAASWVLYLSFVQVGQLFYGYGWETQLLETGFLAIFLCPLASLGPFPGRAPPVVVIWLFRWLIVRIMLGAAAIKLRGDPCWRDFTCLVYHYETQPIPNPLSWWFNALPRWAHVIGVAFNHLVELGAPFLVVGPRRARLAAGILFVTFQLVLIASGNLSFLNWLTIVPALACFDDRFLSLFLPRSWREALARRSTSAPERVHELVAWGLAVVVALLSINPVLNLLSSHQAMNRSFDRLHLVNTYGAFGSVGRERDEVIVFGTDDDPEDPNAVWREYQFPCKPGDVARRPCWISPYHERLDWQLWFAAMSSIHREPWLVHLAAKLLAGDPGIKRLLAVDPFADAPPRYVKIDLYRYQFTRPNDGSSDWWRRTYVGPYVRPVSLDDPELRRYLAQYGWDSRALQPRRPNFGTAGSLSRGSAGASPPAVGKGACSAAIRNPRSTV